MSRRKGRSPVARGWEAMQPAVNVPLSEEHRTQILDYFRSQGLSADEARAALEKHTGAEVWRNHKYTVTVTRGGGDGMVQELSIRRNDRKAARDWRDFQRIKTEIAGADVEAFEMYPAEDRLIDTANQYYLYCLPPGQRIPAGYTGPRNLRDSDDRLANSEQRPLPQDWKDHA